MTGSCEQAMLRWTRTEKIINDTAFFLCCCCCCWGVTINVMHCVCQGTMRVLLVLLHDFPEFLCEYHYAFCDVIPPNCIQVRNLVLSAFPRNMRLPDPFTPNLKVDMLPDIAHVPPVMSNFVNFIQEGNTFLLCFRKVQTHIFFVLFNRARRICLGSALLNRVPSCMCLTLFKLQNCICDLVTYMWDNHIICWQPLSLCHKIKFLLACRRWTHTWRQELRSHSYLNSEPNSR